MLSYGRLRLYRFRGMNMAELSNCSRALAPGSCFITRYRAEQLPSFIPLYLYSVFSKIPPDTESSTMGRVGGELTRINEIPVVRFRGKTLVSPRELSFLEVSVQGIKVESSGTIRINTLGVDERKAILRLALLSIKSAAAESGFVTGISNLILSPRFRLEDEQKTAGLQSGVVFSVDLDESNVLVLDCDMKSRILSQQSVASRILADKNFNPVGLVVSSLQSVESMTIEKVTDRSVSKKVKALGQSIFAYNDERGNYDFLEKIHKHAPVVACSVGDAFKTYDYDSQLLFESLDFRAIRKVDPDFAATVSDYTKMDISERESFLSFFVRKLRSEKMPLWLTFAQEPEVAGDGNPYTAWNVALPQDNLIFGKNRKICGQNGRSSSVEEGIKEFGLHSLPETIRIGLLYPEGSLDIDYSSYGRKLVQDLVEMSRAGQDVFSIHWEGTYNSLNPFRIKSAIEEYSQSGSDIALVLLPPRGGKSPYVTLKAELSKSRCASQMIHYDPHVSQRQIVNVLVGVTSKIGNSGNWCIDRLLWSPDLFVGLSAAAHSDGRQVVVATAFDSRGRALDVTVESFESGDSPGNVITRARLLHLIEGSLFGYRCQSGQMPRSVVVHRDGEFVESSYNSVWEHFEELGVQCTLVEVDRGLPPRIGTTSGGGKVSPPPGTLFRVSDTQGFLITTQTEGRGAPKPVGFSRIGGTMDIVSIGHQIFWLSRAHMGSVMPSRLPVTIHFARKVSDMVVQGTVPQGTMGPRLLFV